MTDPVLDQIARSAAGLSDYSLDEHLAAAVARRDVSVAHGRHSAAARYNELAIVLADVRQTRADVAKEIDELTGPPSPIVRPLTAEELAEPGDGSVK